MAFFSWHAARRLFVLGGYWMSKDQETPLPPLQGRAAYASVMLAHFLVVVTDEFHDNRLRNSRFLQKSNCGMAQAVERNVPIPPASPLFLVIGFAVWLLLS